MPDTLGGRIRELRLNHIPIQFVDSKPYYLSLRGLEKMSGVSNSEICLIENGKIKNPSVSSVYKIAKALGTTVEALLTGEK